MPSMDLEALRRDEQAAAVAFHEAVRNGPRGIALDGDDEASRPVRDAYRTWLHLFELRTDAERYP